MRCVTFSNPVRGLTSDPLARGIRGGKGRELLLQIEQIPVETVILGVADGWLRKHVIRVVVLSKILRQSGVLPLPFQECHSRHFYTVPEAIEIQNQGAVPIFPGGP